MNAISPQQQRQGRRHLWVFALTAGLLFALVAGFNLYIFKVIAAPANQRILQNNVGWERSYKPILFDELKPKVAVFGASWARDAFDYEEMTSFFGREFFNFAASGAQPYENLRFLQSALALGSLDTVILNLDSFSAYQRRPPTQYGFNEDILSVKPDGTANPFKTWHRLFALTLSGAAIASNVSSLKLLSQAQQGTPKEQMLRAYDRADYRQWPGAAEGFQQRRSEAPRLDESPRRQALPADIEEQGRYLVHLKTALREVCQRGITTYTYLTPHHAFSFFGERLNDKLLARQLAILDALQAARRGCKARLHFYDFHYPNGVTLESISVPLEFGELYRSDLHPRPAVGRLMVQKMFASASASARPGDPQEFGTDLLAMSDDEAKRWISQRFARWFK
jgi:hypothetical protein